MRLHALRNWRANGCWSLLTLLGTLITTERAFVIYQTVAGC
jgi:hypothetical protein